MKDATGAGAILRDCRKKGGVSQRDLAERSGVASTTICNIEIGNVNPRFDTLEILLNALGYKITVKSKEA